MIFAKTKSVHGTRKELITVYTMIGLESGSTIVKNVLASEAPSRYAASRRDVGIVSKNPFATR